MSTNNIFAAYPTPPATTATAVNSGVSLPSTVNVTANVTANVTTTATPGFFEPAVLSNAWENNKFTVGWLVPAVIAVVVLLALLAFGTFHCIRGVELWVLKCCHENCGCCPPNNSSRGLETEFTPLTDTLHDRDVSDLEKRKM